MEDVAAGWTMTQIHLEVVAIVPKVAQCDFVDAALRAKANCPITRSLNANISMSAKLSQLGSPVRPLPKQNWTKAETGILRKKGLKRIGARN
jgi:hypothetical protein